MFLQRAIFTKFWEKVVDHINDLLKFSEDNVHLNYIPNAWNLTTQLLTYSW